MKLRKAEEAQGEQRSAMPRLYHNPLRNRTPRMCDVGMGRDWRGWPSTTGLAKGSNFYRSGGGARKSRMVTRHWTAVPGTTALFAERASTGVKPDDTSW